MEMRNTYLQLLQLASGAVIGILLLIHVAVQRLDVILGFFGVKAGDPLAFSSMMERARQGSWAALYILLLAFALFHGGNGLRNMLLETSLSPKAVKASTVIIIAVGIIFLALGIYTPLVLLGK
jgi:succinate dehydrogenase hydrophobic anchor subunit